MNRKEHILATISEECDEVSQRVIKALRFSLAETQPGQEFSNADRIMHEWADLCGMMSLAIDEGILKLAPDHDERVAAKRGRFEKFLGRSAEHGTLTDKGGSGCPKHPGYFCGCGAMK
jgi:hypothetical protein